MVANGNSKMLTKEFSMVSKWVEIVGFRWQRYAELFKNSQGMPWDFQDVFESFEELVVLKITLKITKNEKY